jgi:hypothetical protein
MAPREDSTARYRVAAPEGTWPRDQWPVDVQRTDASGEIDLAQLEYNLSLTPAQRVEQYLQWLEFIEIAREAGRRHRAMEHRSVAAAE